jgi:hypothetical protein
MSASARTMMRVWKNSRDVKTGIAAQSFAPCEVAIISEDNDISDTSKSPYFSWRQNISDGWIAVARKRMACAVTSPSSSGRVFSLSASARLRSSFVSLLAAAMPTESNAI